MTIRSFSMWMWGPGQHETWQIYDSDDGRGDWILGECFFNGFLAQVVEDWQEHVLEVWTKPVM